MVFKDRAHAAHLLAARLSTYRGRNPLILGIPRGGAIMAALIAEELDGELDVALVTKLRAPDNPELAIGAVAETGEVFLDTRSFWGEAVPDDYRKAEVERGMEVLRSRRAAYTPARPPVDPAGRLVILVDDGIATGSTMIAALKSVGSRKAARRVAAAPVAPAGATTIFANYADEVVLLHESESFRGVSQFYEKFGEVTDPEVISALERNGARFARRAG